MMETDKDFSRHNQKMKRIAAVREKMQASKTIERGLLIVHTGNGKGKSTAAFGMALRALGWGLEVGIVQYVKGKWETGERRFFETHPNLLTFAVMGDGFTWETQDRARDIEAAQAAWQRSKEMIADPGLGLVILDELNIVIRHDSVPFDDVLSTLKSRPLDKHVCITGRGARPELIGIADLVTEFAEVKHPYRAGFKAQKGVEY
jgi:cob(I)alamin adenosyltransferase